MTFVRKLLKWILILVAIVAVALLIVIWPVLGVNPFEGDADHLWELVSKDVHFFVRCAGTGTLKTDLADDLAGRPGFEAIEDARVRLLELTESIAKQAQIPFDMVEVDFNRDFLAKEWAFAGTIFTDYSKPRADNFIFLTRIAYYGRFISALQRGFIRDKLPPDVRDRISPEKGYYVRVRLTPEEMKSLKPLRSVRARDEPDIIYLGRVKDVLIISDNADWMDHAILGRNQTLAADPWFETEFARNSIGGKSVEVFLRPSFSGNMMLRHGEGPDAHGPLAALAKVLPVNLTGEVALRIDPQPNGIGLEFDNNPPPGGYQKLDPASHDYVRQLYEAEKGDLRAHLSENGIARFIPKDDVVAAAVLCAQPGELAGLVMSILTPDERQLLEEQAKSNGYPRGFERLFRDELIKRLGREHLIIVHRPKVFKSAPFHLYRENDDNMPADATFTPEPRLHYTLVSRVQDGVAPDAIRRTMTKFLSALGLKPGNPEMGGAGATDPSGRFHLAQPFEDFGELVLVRPSYGAMSGQQPYFVFSTHIEAATAVFDAAENQNQQKIREPATRAAVQKIQPTGTLALLAFGDAIADALSDQVRIEYEPAHDPDGEATRARKKLIATGIKENDPDLDRQVAEAVRSYIERTYPDFRNQFLAGLAPLRAFDTIAFGANLGVPPHMGVRGRGFAQVRARDGGAE